MHTFSAFDSLLREAIRKGQGRRVASLEVWRVRRGAGPDGDAIAGIRLIDVARHVSRKVRGGFLVPSPYGNIDAKMPTRRPTRRNRPPRRGDTPSGNTPAPRRPCLLAAAITLRGRSNIRATLIAIRQAPRQHISRLRSQRHACQHSRHRLTRRAGAVSLGDHTMTPHIAYQGYRPCGNFDQFSRYKTRTENFS